MWIESINGPVNLEGVVRVVCQTNGDAYLYYDSTNYSAVSLGTDHDSAVAKANRLVRAVDPVDS